MKNKKLSWKSVIPATCPYCGDRSDYIVSLNTRDIFCNKCDKLFYVDLYATNVELKATNQEG